MDKFIPSSATQGHGFSRISDNSRQTDTKFDGKERGYGEACTFFGNLICCTLASLH